MAEIDPTGTQPGVVRTEEEPKPVDMKCKNPNCDSILATELKTPGVGRGQHLFQCVKCKQSWSVSVGGGVDW